MKSFSESNFDQEVLKCSSTCLVDFWAAWCGPCNTLMPVLEKFVEKNPGIRVGRVIVEENQDLATQYSIIAVPTLIFFKKGQPIKRLVGLQTEETLQQAVESL